LVQLDFGSNTNHTADVYYIKLPHPLVCLPQLTSPFVHDVIPHCDNMYSSCCCFQKHLKTSLFSH